MENLRDKLLELVYAAHNAVTDKAIENHSTFGMSYSEQIETETDHLIANGVTVQQWIPVTERLPQEFVSVLVCIPSENPLPTVKEAYLANGAWATKMAVFFMEEVTHWMPLPEPPKEVE